MNISAWVILIFILILIIWDVFLIIIYGPTGTVSWDMWEVSKQHPIIPFCFGCLMAHWFWRN